MLIEYDQIQSTALEKDILIAGLTDSEDVGPAVRAAHERGVSDILVQALEELLREDSKLGSLFESTCGGSSMVKVPSSAGQSSPSQPPRKKAFGSRLLHTLWRSHGATPLALGG